MFEYTSQNHFQFGYSNGRRFCNRESTDEVFVAEYGSSFQKPMTWREANIHAAIEIGSKTKEKICVLFSGGTDSEICVRSFQEAKVPIQICTLKFTNEENSHDIFFVEKLKSELNLEVAYYDLNVRAFWESREFYEIVDRVQCVSPILACHLWLADQLNGLPVIGQGEPHLKKEIASDYVPGKSPYLPSSWSLIESERLCSLYKHFIFSNRPAIPGFFQYHTNQVNSYLTRNLILDELISNRVPGKLGTRSSKNSMAQQFYPEIVAREKYTGFEKLTLEHDLKRLELSQRFPHCDQNFKIDYDELVAHLNG